MCLLFFCYYFLLSFFFRFQSLFHPLFCSQSFFSSFFKSQSFLIFLLLLLFCFPSLPFPFGINFFFSSLLPFLPSLHHSVSISPACLPILLLPLPLPYTASPLPAYHPVLLVFISYILPPSFPPSFGLNLSSLSSYLSPSPTPALHSFTSTRLSPGSPGSTG